MKKYYIIYIIAGLAFILCLLTVIFNPVAIRFLNPMTRSKVDLTGQVKSSTIGDVLLIILGVVSVLGVIAAYIHHIYQFIQKIRKKGKPDEAEEEVSRRTSDEIAANIIAHRQGYPDKEENKTD